jgi:hypothetical protein
MSVKEAHICSLGAFSLVWDDTDLVDDAEHERVPDLPYLARADAGLGYGPAHSPYDDADVHLAVPEVIPDAHGGLVGGLDQRQLFILPASWRLKPTLTTLQPSERIAYKVWSSGWIVRPVP